MERSIASKPHVCFEVEKVIGISSDGSYQVQWAPAWVSKFHLVGCEHLIQEFLHQQHERVHSKTSSDPNELHIQEREGGKLVMLPDCRQQYGSILHGDCDTEVVAVQEENYYESEPYPVRDGGAAEFETCGMERPSTDNLLVKEVTKELTHRVEPEYDTEADYQLRAGGLGGQHHDNLEYHESMPDICVKVENDENTTDIDNDTSWTISMVSNNKYSYDSYNNSGNKSLSETSTKALADCSTISPSKSKITSCREISSGADLQADDVGDQGANMKKVYICSVCGHNFQNRSSFLSHYRTHTGDKPYGCHICGKSFARKDNLRTHLRLHTGEKPYSCSGCGVSFTHRPSLMRHYKTCELWTGNAG